MHCDQHPPPNFKAELIILFQRPPPPPEDDDDVCFGEEYIDPETGRNGCCPRGKPYSYDSVTLKGDCCARDNTYSYNTEYKIGSCCDAGIELTCGCGFSAAPIAPATPETPAAPVPSGVSSRNPCPYVDQNRHVESGLGYKLHCGKWVEDNKSTLKPAYTTGSLKECLRDCTAEP